MDRSILLSLLHLLVITFIVQCSPVSHLESSASALRSKVPNVSHLEAIGPESWYPATVERVVQGRGSNIPRTADMQEKYTQYFANVQKIMTLKEQIHNQLGWHKIPNEENLPEFLDSQSYGRSNLVKILKNDFPWQLPKQVVHYVVWMRFPLVTKASFAKTGDEKLPSWEYTNQKRISALLEYIEQHPFFGYSGIDPKLINSLNPGKELHPQGKPYKTSDGQFITQAEGWQAIQWAGRHVNAFLQKRFPQSKYEFAWNRSTKKIRSFVDPEHIHVLVRSKEQVHQKLHKKNRSPGHTNLESQDLVPSFEQLRSKPLTNLEINGAF